VTSKEKYYNIINYLINMSGVTAKESIGRKNSSSLAAF